MLTNEKLGRAIAAAIQKKIESGGAKSKAEIARHFGIRPPSLREWELKGTVSKNKLGKLFDYFSDVVDRNHWVDENLTFSASAINEISRLLDMWPDSGSKHSQALNENKTPEMLNSTVENHRQSLVMLTPEARRVNVNYSVELVPGQFVNGHPIDYLKKTISITAQEFSPTAFALIYTGSEMGEMLEHQQAIILDERHPTPGDLCMLRKNDGFMYCVFESKSPFGMVFRLKGTQSRLTVPQDSSYSVFKVLALRNASDIE